MKLKLLFLIVPLILITSCGHFSTKEAPEINYAWISKNYLLELVLAAPASDGPQALPLTLKDFNQFYKLKDDQGKVIPLVRLRYLDQKHIQVVTGSTLSLNRNYYFQSKNKTVYGRPTNDYLNQNYYYKGSLGVQRNGEKWTFTLWSPTATDVVLRLYRPDDQRRLVAKRPMSSIAPGVWQVTLDQNKFSQKILEGYHYQYEVHALGETRFGPDPYSYSLAIFNPHDKLPIKSTVVDLKRIAKKYFFKGSKTNKQLLKKRSFLGYEAHLRDLTINSPYAAEDEKGTYLGALSSIDHLQQLGVTHLQIMPVSFFATVNEWDRGHQSGLKPFNTINYNWGYDTQHFFSLSGYLSKYPQNSISRVEEFLQMVQGLHRKNIGVVMDVVYNHLYNGELFENTAPGCYLRRNKDGEISNKSGAGYSFDSQKFMARRMIIDSLDLFHHFYRVNGFRFDLMSFIDRETLQLAQKRLGEDVILYGEGWNHTDLPPSDASTMMQLPSIHFGAFSELARDAILGSLNEPGVVLGNAHAIPRVKSVVTGSIAGLNKDWDFLSQDSFHHFAPTPLNSYNYLDIHDGPTLWDKTNVLSNLPLQEKIKRVAQSYAVLMTSQGNPIIHAGSEMGRTKPTNKMDQEKNSIFYGLEDNKTPLQSNSYRHSDDTNSLDWNKLNGPYDLTSTIRKLSSIRNSNSHFHLATKDEVKRRIEFLTKESEEVVIKKNDDFSSFKQIHELTINFINGPKSKLMYLAGEVQPDYITDDSDKNPQSNSFVVNFDEQGNGSITLSKQQLEDANYSSWSNPDALNIKLVYRPGAWDTLDTAYQGMGNNSIPLYSIDQKKHVTIDLSRTNASAAVWENNIKKEDNYLAYIIKGKNKERNLLIVHNFSDSSLVINDQRITDKITILFKLDKEQPLRDGNKMTVSAHQSVIILL